MHELDVGRDEREVDRARHEPERDQPQPSRARGQHVPREHEADRAERARPDSLTYLENLPATDTVAIASASWNTRRRTLSVEATSNEAPAPTLRMQYSLDGGTTWLPAAGLAMTYSASSGRYAVTTSVSSRPNGVRVTSSRGGVATQSM